MTKTFERFLRSFSDDELVAFARDRGQAHPPYWKVMRVALGIETSRRGLRLEDDLTEVAHRPAADADAHRSAVWR